MSNLINLICVDIPTQIILAIHEFQQSWQFFINTIVIFPEQKSN